MQMPVDLAGKSPQDCSPGQLRDFATLIHPGGEVIGEGLEARVSKDHVIFVFRQSACLLGIAALKKPAAGYRVSVFKKRGATVSPSQYALELGWAVVTPSSRGRKLSHRLTCAAVDYAGNAQDFATSRTDNLGMQAPLLASSFKKHGHDYASDRGAHRLELFLRELK